MQVQSIGADQHLVVAQGLGMRGVRGTAYQGVDLDLAAGQAHAICAENKGGKTELLLTLAGRMLASEGSLTIADIDARHLRGLDKIRPLTGLGFFERVNDVERFLRVRTVVSAELSLAGKPSNRAATEEYLSRWGLADCANAVVDDLERCDFDRLGIALGMAGDPVILVVGDIERDLTEHQSNTLADRLRDLAHSEGVCVICGVNDYDLAARFDTAYCLTEDARAQRAAWERKNLEVEVA